MYKSPLVDRRFWSKDFIDVLSDLFFLRGAPVHSRSAKRLDFVAKVIRKWSGAVGALTAYIEPGSPTGHLSIEINDQAFWRPPPAVNVMTVAPSELSPIAAANVFPTMSAARRSGSSARWL